MSFYLTAQYRTSTMWIYNTDSSISKLECTKTLNILPLNTCKNLKQNQLDLFPLFNSISSIEFTDGTYTEHWERVAYR